MSSPQIYELTAVADCYTFTTGNGLDYKTYFIDGSYILTEELGQYVRIFGFDHASRKEAGIREAGDPAVAPTLITIIQNYFREREAVLAYSCDQSDKKEKGRMMLFNKWFNRYNGKDIKLVKRDRSYENLYVSFIFRPDHPQLYDLEVAISDFDITFGKHEEGNIREEDPEWDSQYLAY